jgi:integrase
MLTRGGTMLAREYGEGKFLPSLVHLRPNSASTYASHLRTHWWPLVGERQMRSLSRSDMKAAVAALAEALPGRYRVAVPLAAGAGLRFGEATGLTVPRVNFLQRRIQVIEQAQNGALAPLETRASRRTVPTDDWVLSEITAHLQRYGTGPSQAVMSNTAGRLVRRSAFGDIWRAAVKAAELPEGTRYHALRHFYASALIAANLNPNVIQSRLGHATIAETMDTYGHLFPDSEDLGRGAVESALAGALAEQRRNRRAQ